MDVRLDGRIALVTGGSKGIGLAVSRAFLEAGARVAILDVDAHHGDGTQQIFYRRDDVLFASIHGDPRDEFPFFLGYADETGEGAGEGAAAGDATIGPRTSICCARSASCSTTKATRSRALRSSCARAARAAAYRRDFPVLTLPVGSRAHRTAAFGLMGP